MTADAVKVSWKVACTIQQPCEFSSRERSIFGAFERASEIVGVDVGDAVRLGVWRWDAQRARHLAVAALSGKGFSDDEITQAMGWVSLPSNDVPLSMYDEIVVRSIQGAT